MFNKTLSTTIAEATERLFAATEEFLVFGCPKEALTEPQRDCLAEYFFEMGFSKEEKDFCSNHIYNNLSNDHLYILEICDAEDDTPRYFYEELIPTIELLRDINGNLFYYEGLDEDTSYHKATMVEEHNGRYINTSIMVYMTNEELEQTTRIVVEGR